MLIFLVVSVFLLNGFEDVSFDFKSKNYDLSTPKISIEKNLDDEELPQWVPPDHDEGRFSVKKEYLLDEDTVESVFYRSKTIPKSLLTNSSRAGHFVVLKDNLVIYKSVNDFKNIGDANRNDFCRLPAGSVIYLDKEIEFRGVYAILSLSEPVPNGCGKTVYVKISDVIASSKGGGWLFSPNVRAFLDMIAYAEGTDDYYNIIFGGSLFESYKDHPNIKVKNGKYSSTAAGRYQFLYKTWKELEKALGLDDFSPPSQDFATIEILRRSYALKKIEINSDLKSFKEAVKLIGNTWTSMPGSQYKQGNKTLDQIYDFFIKELNDHKKYEEKYLKNIKQLIKN